jgi:acetyl esterase/lipase
MKFIVFLLCLGLLTLTSCSDVKFFLVNSPETFDDLNIQDNIVFDKELNLALDIYSSPVSIKPKDKIIVFFYGGGWTSGRKEQYRFVASSLAREGYIVVIPDYRKYPDVIFPDFMFDSAKAVKWVSKNQNKFAPQNADIILMGHSAGANIAFLLMTDQRYGIKNNIDISGGIGLSGPYNFTPNTNTLKNIFKVEQYNEMRPITHIDGSEPPLLMIYGLKDNLVGKFNIDTMTDALKKNKVCHRSILYPYADHIFTVAEFSWIGGQTSKIRRDVLEFLDNVGKGRLCESVSEVTKK